MSYIVWDEVMGLFCKIISGNVKIYYVGRYHISVSVEIEFF